MGSSPVQSAGSRPFRRLRRRQAPEEKDSPLAQTTASPSFVCYPEQAPGFFMIGSYILRLIR